MNDDPSESNQVNVDAKIVFGCLIQSIYYGISRLDSLSTSQSLLDLCTSTSLPLYLSTSLPLYLSTSQSRDDDKLDKLDTSNNGKLDTLSITHFFTDFFYHIRFQSSKYPVYK